MSSETQESAKRRRVRLWHVLVGAVFIVVGAGLTLRWHWRREFRKHIDALAAAGYPVTPEELGAWYPAPTSGGNGAQAVLDAAGCYAEVLTTREKYFIDRLYMLTRQDPLDDEVKVALERLVADNESMLELLREAARFPHYHYDIDWSSDSLWPMEPLPSVGRAAGLLRRAALLAFEKGQGDVAVDSLLASLRISDPIGEIPTFYGFYWRLLARGHTCVVLERGLNRVMLAEQQLHSLQEALDAPDRPETLARALAAYLCLTLPLFEKPAAHLPSYLPPVPVLQAYGVSGLAACEGSLFIDLMESYRDMIRLPTDQWRSAASAIDAEYEVRSRGCILLFPDGGFSLASRLMRYLKIVAQLKLTRTALAIERYRLAQDALPAALEDLVPDYLARVPSDPFAGSAVRYETLGGGFVVYSVGEDGVDDGGREEPPGDEKKPGQTYDITFTVER